MSKDLKSIHFELSPSSIAKAIMELNDFQKQLKKAMNELVELLTKDGVDIAKMNVTAMGAIYSGALEASINGYFSPNLGAGFIRAGEGLDNGYAIFVEYGTGIIGAASPHPGIGDNEWTDPPPNSYKGHVYDSYDSQGHGADGWVYKKDSDGSYHWTLGYHSRPFMYETYRWLESIAPRRAADTFGHMGGG